MALFRVFYHVKGDTYDYVSEVEAATPRKAREALVASWPALTLRFDKIKAIRS